MNAEGRDRKGLGNYQGSIQSQLRPASKTQKTKIQTNPEEEILV